MFILFLNLSLPLSFYRLHEFLYSEVWCLKPELEECFLLDNFLLPNSFIILCPVPTWGRGGGLAITGPVCAYKVSLFGILLVLSSYLRPTQKDL